MIYEKILDELKKDYELIQGKNGFKLYTKTEIGSGDVFFSEHNNKFYCSYKIKNPDSEIIQKGSKEFEKELSAKAYLLIVCCSEIYSKLGLDDNN